MALQKTAKDDRSIGELFNELAGEAGNLIRQEINLAKAELISKAVKIQQNLGLLGLGLAFGLVSFLTLTMAVILILSIFMPLWLSALIVGFILAITAAVISFSAIQRLKETNPMPKETIATIKEDTQWLKKQI
ncbi:MAG: phage holin family protein [Pyrinomonadaceae bacterium]|nr:phage holin family protein [Pyrinomonadaceae bacterium]